MARSSKNWPRCRSTPIIWPGPTRPLRIEQFDKRLADDNALTRHPAGRYVFMRAPHGVYLFVDGEGLACKGAAARFAERLCADAAWRITPRQLRARDARALALELYNFGALLFDDEC